MWIFLNLFSVILIKSWSIKRTKFGSYKKKYLVIFWSDSFDCYCYINIIYSNMYIHTEVFQIFLCHEILFLRWWKYNQLGKKTCCKKCFKIISFLANYVDMILTSFFLKHYNLFIYIIYIKISAHYSEVHTNLRIYIKYHLIWNTISVFGFYKFKYLMYIWQIFVYPTCKILKLIFVFIIHKFKIFRYARHVYFLFRETLASIQ